MIKNTKLGGSDWNEPSDRVKPGDLNDTQNEVVRVLEGNMRISAQDVYERLKNAPTSVLNADYFGADNFISEEGVNRTVDTESSTTTYDDTGNYHTLKIIDEAGGDTTHDPDNFDNPGNAFDGDDSTYASKSVNSSDGRQTWEIGKTFNSKTIIDIKIKANAQCWCDTTAVDAHSYLKLQTYDGSNWNTEATLATATVYDGTKDASYEGLYRLNKSVQGIRLVLVVSAQSETAGDGTATGYVYTLEYGDFDTSSNLQTHTIINEKTPKRLVVYGKKDLPTNTGITIDISQDGGSTWDITNQDLDSYIDTSSFTGSDLAIKFNLSTTDSSVTPKLYGYSVVITE